MHSVYIFYWFGKSKVSHFIDNIVCTNTACTCCWAETLRSFRMVKQQTQSHMHTSSDTHSRTHAHTHITALTVPD